MFIKNLTNAEIRKLFLTNNPKETPIIHKSYGKNNYGQPMWTVQYAVEVEPGVMEERVLYITNFEVRPGETFITDKFGKTHIIPTQFKDSVIDEGLTEILQNYLSQNNLLNYPAKLKRYKARQQEKARKNYKADTRILKELYSVIYSEESDYNCMFYGLIFGSFAKTIPSCGQIYLSGQDYDLQNRVMGISSTAIELADAYGFYQVVYADKEADRFYLINKGLDIVYFSDFEIRKAHKKRYDDGNGKRKFIYSDYYNSPVDEELSEKWREFLQQKLEETDKKYGNNRNLKDHYLQRLSEYLYLTGRDTETTF